MERTHVAFCLFVIHDKASLSGLGEDDSGLIADFFEDLPDIEGRGDLLCDSFDIFKSFSV